MKTFDYNSLTGPASGKTVKSVANKFAKMTIEKKNLEDSAANFVKLRGRFMFSLCKHGESNKDGKIQYTQTRQWFKAKTVPASILKLVKFDGLVKA